MAGGYMGKALWVDLSAGKLKEEVLDEKLCRDFIGGYGIGARMLYSRQKGGVDPLGPDNIFGFTTGPLTGTPAVCGSRYTVVGKSPLTGGWGDANSGGDFGPNLKFAGYDMVFFTGIAKKPTYLFIQNGKAELKDASKLWGKDSNETEELLMAEYGKNVHVACIGQSGETLSLISCVMNNKGRAAGRSGLGAVMGSKKLKAVAVMGKMEVPLPDKTKANELRRQQLKELTGGFLDILKKWGTAGITANSAVSGDSPVKNWGGVGIVDFKEAKPISDDNVIALQEKTYACWRCPIACGGHMKPPKGEYKWGPETHKPEYETLSMFGSNLLNNNLESIIKASDICNRYGLDTISAGAAVALAIECYENGILSKEDTDGLELKWGNHRAIVAMTEKLAKREGRLGTLLADGVKAASEKIGRGAPQFAMHIQGEEVPAHDPKFGYHFATIYWLDATPARHTQGTAGLAPKGLVPQFNAKSFSGRGEADRRLMNMHHIMNCAGMCMFGYMSLPNIDSFLNMIKVTTGWDVTVEELVKTGERIADLRHAFNLREGVNPLQYKIPGRIFGNPPLKAGPLANVTVDEKAVKEGYFAAMDWDLKTAKPSKKRLLELGLNDVAKDLYR